MIKLIINNPRVLEEGQILHFKVISRSQTRPGIWELVVEHVPPPVPADVCSDAHPCCDRRGDYNGFGSGPLTFTCPQGCRCHD